MRDPPDSCDRARSGWGRARRGVYAYIDARSPDKQTSTEIDNINYELSSKDPNKCRVACWGIIEAHAWSAGETSDPSRLTQYCVAHTICNTARRSSVGGSTEAFENLRLELRRGCLVMAVLAELRREQYGYTLRRALGERGLEVDEGTLYPLLRRLESQGLLASEWREEDKRNKRFYRLSTNGKLVLKQLPGEGETIDSSLPGIPKENRRGKARSVL